MPKNIQEMTKKELDAEWQKIRDELESKEEAAEDGCCEPLTDKEKNYLILAIWYTTPPENKPNQKPEP